MELFAVVVTIIAGFLGAGLLGNWLNWPDAGAVVAVAVMGGFILRQMRREKEK